MAKFLRRKELEEQDLAALEAKRKKRKKKIIYWSIVTGFLVLFFASSAVMNLIWSSAPINRFLPINVLGADMSTEPFYIALLRALYLIFIIYLILKAVWIISKILSVKATNRQKTIISMIASFIKYIGLIVAIFVLLANFGVDITTMLAAGGVIGLIIGFGAQSLVADILAGLFIISENSFEVGDIIVFNGDMRGEVAHIGVRTTKIRTVGGDVHIINNSEMRVLTNQSQHRSMAVCNVCIDYSEDLEKVEKIMKDAFPDIAKRYPNMLEGPVYFGCTEFTSSGVVMGIFARVEEPNRMQTNRDLNREMKLLFDKHGIKFAVPNVKVKNSKEKD